MSFAVFPVLAADAGASAQSQPGASGTVVVMGGAVRDDNDALWSAVVQAAGGPGARVLVLPTASAEPQRSGAAAAAQLQRRGAVVEVLPIAPRWPGGSQASAQALAHDTQWVRRVEQASGLFMTGGDQERLMDVLQPQGRASPLLQAMHALLARGGVIAGTSAGAAVMSRTAIRALDDPFDALLRPLTPDERGEGFGVLPEHIVVDQHFLRRGRLPRLLRLLLQGGRTLGIGVEEDSAAIVRGGVAVAVGARGLVVVDAGEAVVEQEQPLRVRGLRIGYVDRGDRLDLRSGRLLPTAGREPLPAGPATGDPGFFGDILADNVVVGAMVRAVDGEGRAALGLAWRRHGPVAFEWQLRADERTRAFAGRTRDDLSIEGLRLDIRPVALSQPVYRDLAAGSP